MRSSLVVGAGLAIGLVHATSYNLVDDYTDGNFFDKFDFYTGADPTDGWVNYLTYDNASDCGLIKDTSPPTWGVDNNNVIDPSNTAGRPSVRLTSQNTYNHGLFILDLAHMPYSACGVWPAFWTFGQSATWPVGGEIDIVEYVNGHSTDLMTLHTADGCTINSDSTMTGDLVSPICDVSQGNGCSINNTDITSAGTGFNNNGGGVYAMEWTSEIIQVWFFPSDDVPSSITDGSPDTSTFGKPQALFEGSGCNIDEHFYDHAIVFDLTFCGDWAGTSFEVDGCPMTTDDALSSCQAYVGENPSAYDYSYWSVNSLKVYSQDTSDLKARSSYAPEPTASNSSGNFSATTTPTSVAEHGAHHEHSHHGHGGHQHFRRHAHRARNFFGW